MLCPVSPHCEAKYLHVHNLGVDLFENHKKALDEFSKTYEAREELSPDDAAATCHETGRLTHLIAQMLEFALEYKECYGAAVAAIFTAPVHTPTFEEAEQDMWFEQMTWFLKEFNHCEPLHDTCQRNEFLLAVALFRMNPNATDVEQIKKMAEVFSTEAKLCKTIDKTLADYKGLVRTTLAQKINTFNEKASVHRVVEVIETFLLELLSSEIRMTRDVLNVLEEHAGVLPPMAKVVVESSRAWLRLKQAYAQLNKSEKPGLIEVTCYMFRIVVRIHFSNADVVGESE